MSNKKSGYYFSHDFGARHNRKFTALKRDWGVAGVGLYWEIVELLHEEGGYLDMKFYDVIAYTARVNEEMVTAVIHNYNLFIIDDVTERISANRVLKNLEEMRIKSEKARQSVNHRWNKHT